MLPPLSRQPFDLSRLFFSAKFVASGESFRLSSFTYDSTNSFLAFTKGILIEPPILKGES